VERALESEMADRMVKYWNNEMIFKSKISTTHPSLSKQVPMKSVLFPYLTLPKMLTHQKIRALPMPRYTSPWLVILAGYTIHGETFT